MTALRDRLEIDRIYTELLPLFTASWEEVGKTPFKPQEEVIKFMWARGIIQEVRTAHGYALISFSNNMFDSVKDAQVISIYLKPEYRKSRESYSLLKQTLKTAKDNGAKRIVFLIWSDSADQNKTFEHLCGKPINFGYRKEL